jgi:hypothetical protein
MLAFESRLGAELLCTIGKAEQKKLVGRACLGPMELLDSTDKVR